MNAKNKQLLIVVLITALVSWGIDYYLTGTTIDLVALLFGEASAINFSADGVLYLSIVLHGMLFGAVLYWAQKKHLRTKKQVIPLTTAGIFLGTIASVVHVRILIGAVASVMEIFWTLLLVKFLTLGIVLLIGWLISRIQNQIR